jgi:hypothetical protein
MALNESVNISHSVDWSQFVTDTIIPSDSNHPIEHKLSLIRFLVNRLHTYPITGTHKLQEFNTIRQILHANIYHPTTIHKIHQKIQTSEHEPKRQSLTTLQTTSTRHKTCHSQQKKLNLPLLRVLVKKLALSQNVSITQTTVLPTEHQTPYENSFVTNIAQTTSTT